MSTTREQVEAALRARGLREEAPGDWRGAGAFVRLDVRHAPDVAWYTQIYNGAEMPGHEELSYTAVLARFG